MLNHEVVFKVFEKNLGVVVAFFVLKGETIFYRPLLWSQPLTRNADQTIYRIIEN